MQDLAGLCKEGRVNGIRREQKSRLHSHSPGTALWTSQGRILALFRIKSFQLYKMHQDDTSRTLTWFRTESCTCSSKYKHSATRAIGSHWRVSKRNGAGGASGITNAKGQGSSMPGRICSIAIWWSQWPFISPGGLSLLSLLSLLLFLNVPSLRLWSART